MAGDSGNTLRTQEFNQRAQAMAGQAQSRGGEAMQGGLTGIAQTYLRERQQGIENEFRQAELQSRNEATTRQLDLNERETRSRTHQALAQQRQQGIDNQFRQTAMEVEQRQMQVRNEAMMRQLQTDEMEAHSRIQLDQVRKQEAMQKLAIAQQIIALDGTKTEVGLLKAQLERQQLENEEKKRNSAGVGDLRDSTLYASLFLQQEGKRRDKSGRWVNDPDATQESKDLAKSMLGGFGELIGERKEAPSMSRLREAQAKQIELENAETEEAARNKLKSTTPTASGFKPVPVEEMRKLPYFNNEVVRNLSKFPQAMPVGLRAVANERMPEMMATLVNDFLSTKAGAGLSVADGVKYIQRTLDKLDPRDLWGAIADTYQDRAQLDSLMKAYDGIK